MLRVNNASVGYSNKIVVDNISFSVNRGEITTLIGPNGSGKSTVLKSIIRQLRLIGGAVEIEGVGLDRYSNSELAKKMSVMLTARPNPELMSCREMVETGRYPYTNRLGGLSSVDKQAVDEAIALLGIEEISDMFFSRISDGQRQRVMLARALCRASDIIILDEPTSYLDIRHKLELLNILRDYVNKKNIAVVMSLHEIELAQKVSDCIICVGNGRIERLGSPEEIFKGDYIHRLYGMDSRSYNSLIGMAELNISIAKIPRVFVIAGGGSGIEHFRRLNRRSIPFATGVLHRNDIDYYVADMLACEVVSEAAFEPISDKNIARARQLIASCEEVLCTLSDFGTLNARNAELISYAQELNRLKRV